MMTKSHDNNDHDAAEFMSPFVGKAELLAGEKRHTVTGVSKTTFEVRGNRPEKTVLVLDLDGGRR